MATKKKTSNLMTHHLFLPTSEESIITSNDHMYEFEESDVWNLELITSSETKKKVVPLNSNKHNYPKKIRSNVSKLVGSSSNTTSSSLPVNAPDWSKRYKKEKEELYGEEDTYFWANEQEACEESIILPPHEYLARRWGDSFSVHEGIGRTLKGRDLTQVRNAIWKKIGFAD